MKDLDDIRAFLEVARSGSFGRAGRTLGLSKSMVSRRLARLEQTVGAQLVSRTTRGVVVTEAGHTFIAHAERALAELDAAREAVSSEDGELDGQLRVAAPLSFGTTHLAPVLAEFGLMHPRLRLYVSYSDRFVDLIRERFDCAIRLGSLPDSSLVARRVAPMHGAMVASPAYVKRHGAPRTVEDLANHQAILQGDTTWPLVVGGRGMRVPVQGRFETDSGEAVLAAALAGVGVALLPTFLCGEHIAAGRLQVLLPEARVPEFGLYVVRPRRRVPCRARSACSPSCWWSGSAASRTGMPATSSASAGCSVSPPPARRRRPMAPARSGGVCSGQPRRSSP